uniref:ABC transporter domain-containing protein n=1 Tax=Parascaris equorum TaxID=6256 RepID=A0A914RU65_PAREQ
MKELASGMELISKKRFQNIEIRAIMAMLFASIATMNSATYFPEFTLRGNILFEDVKFSYQQKSKQPRFDGRDLKKLSLYSLRNQMALVGQEPRLFAGSIKENVCFGIDDEVPTEKIMKALELANAKSFVEALPQGLDTEVGEKGTQLSVIRDPKILLLDEATSALDSEAERAVQEALDRARAGRTCITIAHRLSSIQHSDLIIYMEHGKVQESGTHASLMTRGGRYYELIKKQDLLS